MLVEKKNLQNRLMNNAIESTEWYVRCKNRKGIRNAIYAKVFAMYTKFYCKLMDLNRKDIEKLQKAVVV